MSLDVVLEMMKPEIETWIDKRAPKVQQADELEALKDETLKDFGPVYDALKGQVDLPIETVLPSDQVFTRGTQAYASKGGRFAA